MRRIRTGLILSVGVAVASCGGSSTEPEDLLTGAEALALFEVAMSQGLQLTDELEPGSETLTPDGAVLQFTVPCTMGGTVGVTARLGPAGEPDVDGASVGVSMTLVHSGCIEKHETSGITFTLDGAPDLEMSIELSISTEFMLGISGAMDGTVRWATGDGRRGPCALDVEIETVSDPSGLPTITLAGQACGADIVESIPGLGLAFG